MDEIEKMIANAYPQAHGTSCQIFVRYLLTYVDMVSVRTMLWTCVCVCLKRLTT